MNGLNSNDRELLRRLTERLNLIESNAKRIDELPYKTIIDNSDKIHISDNGTSKYITVQELLSAIKSQKFDHIIFINGLNISGTLLTVESASWSISEVINSLVNKFEIEIPYAKIGHSRTDILIAKRNNELQVVFGSENEGISFAPPLPPNTVLITTLDVTDNSINSMPGEIGINNFIPLAGTNKITGDLLSKKKTFTIGNSDFQIVANSAGEDPSFRINDTTNGNSLLTLKKDKAAFNVNGSWFTFENDHLYIWDKNNRQHVIGGGEFTSRGNKKFVVHQNTRIHGVTYQEDDKTANSWYDITIPNFANYFSRLQLPNTNGTVRNLPTNINGHYADNTGAVNIKETFPDRASKGVFNYTESADLAINIIDIDCETIFVINASKLSSLKFPEGSLYDGKVIRIVNMRPGILELRHLHNSPQIASKFEFFDNTNYTMYQFETLSLFFDRGVFKYLDTNRQNQGIRHVNSSVYYAPASVHGATLYISTNCNLFIPSPSDATKEFNFTIITASGATAVLITSGWTVVAPTGLKLGPSKSGFIGRVGSTSTVLVKGEFTN
ncbi:hypothetical protein K5I29_02470 [Flavobacterium agricola]|uniref:Uncharacterized protein n=1 Tax=Flavobacterium agricola TaxID=2870839 RepID=A0ABY6LZT7_9FLAO|nr:hypothetical protein [Flavobacterium agricola]UYW01807.1 hypothetical protein K5I29_02470 [Flavobacterium agricola]